MKDKLNHFPSASSLMLDLRSSECVTSFTFVNMILIPYSALDKLPDSVLPSADLVLLFYSE